MKKIWITGASSGIGKALALKFANEGWQVAASARRENLLQKLHDSYANIIPFNFSPVNRTVAPNFSFKTKPKVTSKADPAVSRFTLIITPGEDGAELPTDYTLSQNYPNPFNPQTTIELELPKQTVVDLSIYNILGQKVTTLVNGEVPAGLHTYTWNAGGNSSGIYFYRLTTENGIETKKMTLLK